MDNGRDLLLIVGIVTISIYQIIQTIRKIIQIIQEFIKGE